MINIYTTQFINVPTIISTKKNAVVRLNMLTSLHFFPVNLPWPLPFPAPILFNCLFNFFSQKNHSHSNSPASALNVKKCLQT